MERETEPEQMTVALVIHGHFYQPPRENPWTGFVDREPGARPFENWNERIQAECYRPNGFARIFDTYGRVEDIVNNYARISFNFGPTLLYWLERHHPDTYSRILEADRLSAGAHKGHGNAIAQGYSHAILPLCNERDRRTQVRWGVADFRHRFKREPESLWLPETACDDATMALLIDEGLKYVILAPHQAERVRLAGASLWRNVADGQIDTSVPYKYLHPDGSGRSIAVFFYNSPLARAIAFEGAMSSSQGLVDRFARAVEGIGTLVNVATDGESYGHHFHFGDRCLAHALEAEAPARGFLVTNYGEFLDHSPPVMEVELKKGPNGEGTAWSCAHGVGRWRRDCSCHANAPEGWNQKWRGPLRDALDFLRDEIARLYEVAGSELLVDVWEARDGYVEVVVNLHRSKEEFLRRHARRELSAEDEVRALTLLEAQRCALLMYASCGWFFNDISGIETIQILKYAERAIELMRRLGLDVPRDEFLGRLAAARSNLPQMGDGAGIYRNFVEPARVSPERVAASLAMTSLIDQSVEAGEAAGFIYLRKDFQKQRHGRLALATGRFELEEIATGARFCYALAAMHFGDVDFYCVLKPFTSEELFRASAARLWTNFRAGSLLTMLRLAQEEFGPDEYSLEHLLPDHRRYVSELVFRHMVERFLEEYEFLYEDNRRVIETLQRAGFELPSEVRAAAEFTFGRKFEKEIREQQLKRDPDVYGRALEIVEEAKRHGYRIHPSAVPRDFEELLVEAVSFAVAHPSVENFQSALTLVTLTRKLELQADLERSQEVIYQALQNGLPALDEVRELATVLGLSSSLLQKARAVKAEDAPAEIARARAAEEEAAMMSMTEKE